MSIERTAGRRRSAHGGHGVAGGVSAGCQGAALRPWRKAGTQPRARREDAVVAHQVAAGRQDDRRQLAQEASSREDEVRAPTRQWPLHPIGQASVLQPLELLEPLESERPAGAVSARATQPLPIVRAQVRVRMQAEAVEEGAPRLPSW